MTVHMFLTGFGFNFAADEQVLSTSMMSYWGSFAWNGNPNVEGQAGMYMVLLCVLCCTVCPAAHHVQCGPRTQPPTT